MSPVVPMSPGPRIPLQPLRVPQLSPNAPREAFGGGIAAERGTLGNLQPAIQGAEAIGAEQARMAYQEKARADQIAVTDAGGKLAQYRTDALYANQNGVDQTGWLGLEGKNAFDMPEKAHAEFWQVADVMRNALTNDDQRAAFDKISAGEWDQMHQQIQMHVGRQRVVYDNDSTQAAIDAKHDQAVKAYDDPTIVEPAIQAQAAVIEKHGERNGLPPEFIQGQVRTATSTLRLSVLKQFVDGANNGGVPQDLAAKAYLDTHRADFVPKDLVSAETLTNRGSVEGEAYRQADIITGVKPAPDGSPLKPVTNEADAEAELAKIDNPLVREKAAQQVSLHFNRVAAGVRQSQETAYLRGHTLLVQNGGDLSKVPTSLAIAMGPHYGTLMGESKRIQTAEDPGDTEQVATLRNEAYFSPETFAARDLTQEKGLSPKQLQSMQTLQRTVGLRQDREEEQPIQRDITQAQHDAIKYRDLVNKAVAADDEEGRRTNTDLWLQAQENEALARRELQEHRSQRAASFNHPSAPQAAAPAPTAAPTQAGATPAQSIPARSTANPVGLTAKTPPTPGMIQDVARKGPGYAAYLDHMGVDTAAAYTAIRQQAAAQAAEEKKKEPKKP